MESREHAVSFFLLFFVLVTFYNFVISVDDVGSLARCLFFVTFFSVPPLFASFWTFLFGSSFIHFLCHAVRSCRQFVSGLLDCFQLVCFQGFFCVFDTFFDFLLFIGGNFVAVFFNTFFN